VAARAGRPVITSAVAVEDSIARRVRNAMFLSPSRLAAPNSVFPMMQQDAAKRKIGQQAQRVTADGEIFIEKVGQSN
jgi:hypothetical protein